MLVSLKCSQGKRGLSTQNPSWSFHPDIMNSSFQQYSLATTLVVCNEYSCRFSQIKKVDAPNSEFITSNYNNLKLSNFSMELKANNFNSINRHLIDIESKPMLIKLIPYIYLHYELCTSAQSDAFGS